jgi:phosphate/sulfate permease
MISSSIGGAGSAERANMVRCGFAGQIAFAGILTKPAMVILGGAFNLLLTAIL